MLSLTHVCKHSPLPELQACIVKPHPPHCVVTYTSTIHEATETRIKYHIQVNIILDRNLMHMPIEARNHVSGGCYEYHPPLSLYYSHSYMLPLYT